MTEDKWKGFWRTCVRCKTKFHKGRRSGPYFLDKEGKVICDFCASKIPLESWEE